MPRRNLRTIDLGELRGRLGGLYEFQSVGLVKSELVTILDDNGISHNLSHQATTASPVPVVAPAPAQDAVTPAGALVDPAKAGPKFNMVKGAMVTQHKHQWPTIERDMNDASTNGLAAAKAGARGWYEPYALEWARANNKLTNNAKPANQLAQAMNSMGNLPGRKHTQKR